VSIHLFKIKREGKDISNMAKVIMASVCQNIEHHFNYIRESFSKLSVVFPSIVFVTFESLSTDSTKRLLQEWVSTDSRVHAFFDDITVQNLTQSCFVRSIRNELCKYEMLARSRNKLQEILEMPAYDAYDFVIYFDWDVYCELPVDKLSHILRDDTVWSIYDGIISYNCYQNNKMVDIHSFRDDTYPFGPEVIGGLYEKTLYEDLVQDHISQMGTCCTIISGFNKLCVLKKQHIKGVRFSITPSKFYDIFLKSRGDKYVVPRLTSVHGAPLGMYLYPLENDGDMSLFYHFNRGFNYPIIHPKVSFFLEMREKYGSSIALHKFLYWCSTPNHVV